MNKLHQTVPLKALIDGGAFLRSKFARAFRLAQLILAFTVSMLFSAGAMAQSADAAIGVAK
jgi:hypothetical protein